MDHAENRLAGAGVGGDRVRLPHHRDQGGGLAQRAVRRRRSSAARSGRAGAGLSRPALQKGLKLEGRMRTLLALAVLIVAAAGLLVFTEPGQDISRVRRAGTRLHGGAVTQQCRVPRAAMYLWQLFVAAIAANTRASWHTLRPPPGRRAFPLIHSTAVFFFSANSLCF